MSPSPTQQDLLQTLPLELRQQVYLYCGFPVAGQWYHTCRDRVVTLARYELTASPSGLLYTADYHDAGDTYAQCTMAHSGPCASLMGVNQTYDTEILSLFANKDYLGCSFRNMSIRELAYSYISSHPRWMGNNTSDDTPLAPLSLHPFSLSAVLAKLTKSAWQAGFDSSKVSIRLDNLALHDQFIDAVRTAVLAFPNLEVLYITVPRHTYFRTPFDDWYKHRFTLADTITSTLSSVVSLQRLVVRQSANRRFVHIDDGEIKSQQTEIAFDVNSLPTTSRAAAMSRLWLRLICVLNEDVPAWPSFPESLYVDSSGFTPLQEEDLALIDVLEELQLSPYAAVLMLHKSRPLTPGLVGEVMRRKVEMAHRSIIGRADDGMPIWSEWIESYEKRCERKQPRRGFRIVDGKFQRLDDDGSESEARSDSEYESESDEEGDEQAAAESE